MNAPAHFRFWPEGLDTASPQLAAPTLPDYLAIAAERHPEKPAILYCENVTTFGELQRRVTALAGFLQQRLDVRTGDRVLLVSQNCPQFVTAYYAILLAGAVVVPVNAMSKLEELRYYVMDSGARVAVVAQEMVPMLPRGEATGELSAVLVHAYSDALGRETLVDELPEGLNAPRAPMHDSRLFDFEDAISQGRRYEHHALSGDDISLLPYTSGTTGHPKGCVHTHASMLAAIASCAGWRQLNSDSVTLAVAPMFHLLGMQSGMNVPIFLGATAVIMPRWNASVAARLIDRHQVRTWSAPPPMVVDLFCLPDLDQYRLCSLVVLACGGAVLPTALAEKLLGRYKLVPNEAYGLTETAAFLHANPLHRGKRQCLGVPTQGVDSRIIDPATHAQLPGGAVGELVTHAPQVMKGYWRNADANRQAFIDIDGKRFFRTGDLAMVDSEGYFFLRDRLKRMINVSGYKVWPAEVESAMYAHPDIQEACVIGVPDEKRGETVKALVVLRPEAKGHCHEQDILEWCRQRMAVYKAPRIVEFVDSLPKSGTGKILWRELQEAQSKG